MLQAAQGVGLGFKALQFLLHAAYLCGLLGLGLARGGCRGGLGTVYPAFERLDVGIDLVQLLLLCSHIGLLLLLLLFQGG